MRHCGRLKISCATMGAIWKSHYTWIGYLRRPAFGSTKSGCGVGVLPGSLPFKSKWGTRRSNPTFYKIKGSARVAGFSRHSDAAVVIGGVAPLSSFPPFAVRFDGRGRPNSLLSYDDRQNGNKRARPPTWTRVFLNGVGAGAESDSLPVCLQSRLSTHAVFRHLTSACSRAVVGVNAAWQVRTA